MTPLARERLVVVVLTIAGLGSVGLGVWDAALDRGLWELLFQFALAVVYLVCALLIYQRQVRGRR